MKNPLKKLLPRDLNFFAKLESYLFFLIIFFLPTQLGRHFWFDFSYIYSLKIDYLSPTIFFWDLLILSLLFCFLLNIVSSRNKSKINSKALLLTLFFLLTQVLSLFNTSNLGASLFRLEQLFLASFLGIYIASKNLSDIKKNLFLGLSSSILLECFLGLGQFFLSHSLGFWILGEREFNLSTPSIAKFNYFDQIFLRPYGTFPHPNVFAGFLVITLPIINLLVKSKINFSIQVLGALLIILTFSRIALAIFFLQIILFFRKKRLLLILILLALASPFLFTRFFSTFSFDYISLIRREQLAEVSLIHFFNSPIFGIGLNNFINATSASSVIAGQTRFLQPVHNIFLLSLAETGIVGFLGFSILIFFPLYKLLKIKPVFLKNVLIFTWFSILILGMFDHYFLTLPQGQRLFFLVWGFSMLELKSGNFKKSISANKLPNTG
ncbi:O-antigen ligase family protein [Candidatus Daviesbacteria bacterium]|nr:O-antigen ligase family protein [Candidatus Daviesbacteria bacterium]